MPNASPSGAEWAPIVCSTGVSARQSSARPSGFVSASATNGTSDGSTALPATPGLTSGSGLQNGQPTSRPAKPVNNLPDSRCLQLEDKTFYCLGAADRYAIETTSEKLLDAQQQVAAQYAMLVSG